jgi:putative chitinase
MITREQLVKIFTKAGRQIVKDGYIDGLLKTMNKYAISENDNRIAMFIAQVSHESMGFRTVIEVLNMTAKRICAVWPNRFPDEASAAPYANNPEKLANNVYANRMGNGTEASGEGFRYRGRGLIQVTGKSNYISFAKSVGKTLDEVVSYLETDEGACESAGWYWNTRNLNPLADAKDVLGVTKKINGGTTGLQDRTMLYNDISLRLAQIRQAEAAQEELKKKEDFEKKLMDEPPF